MVSNYLKILSFKLFSWLIASLNWLKTNTFSGSNYQKLNRRQEVKAEVSFAFSFTLQNFPFLVALFYS